MAAHQKKQASTSTTVTDLVRNFAEGCRRLAPVMDAALIPWSDDEQYDNWERVAEALFISLVSEPCEYAAVGEDQLQSIRIEPYGWDVPPKDCNAYLAALRGEEGPWRVIRLASVHGAFDHVLVTGSGRAESISLSEVSFEFLYSLPAGDLRAIREVDLTL